VTVAYRWSVQSLAPLHFAAGRALGRVTETLQYIPGTALRGAMAAAFLAAHGSTEPGFAPLFEEARFTNLYPAGAAGTASAPLPLSSITCSHQPGFAADGGHGVGDLLLSAEVAQLAAEAATATGAGRRSPVDRDALVACRHCPDERRRLPVPGTVPWRGFCAWQDGEPQQAAVHSSTALERRAAGREQAVTLRQTLAAGQHYTGVVTFPDSDSAEAATQLLAMQEHQIWVGAGRSRGLGAIQVDVATAPAAADDLTQRQEALMAALGRRCERVDVALPDNNYWYMALTLQSAALLADPFGRWQQTITADMLSQWTGPLPTGTWQVRQAFVAGAAVEGWNGGLGLPKPDAVAIAAGSCWLLRIQGASLAELSTALQRLEAEGIGERRQEGFGVVRVCDPLHWRVQELDEEPQI
jgi:CRISPR-associated protein Csx10